MNLKQNCADEPLMKKTSQFAIRSGQKDKENAYLKNKIKQLEEQKHDLEGEKRKLEDDKRELEERLYLPGNSYSDNQENTIIYSAV